MKTGRQVNPSELVVFVGERYLGPLVVRCEAELALDAPQAALRHVDRVTRVGLDRLERLRRVPLGDGFCVCSWEVQCKLRPVIDIGRRRETAGDGGSLCLGVCLFIERRTTSRRH